jgi:PIN domain nuclease of toxin-antitoxin system
VTRLLDASTILAVILGETGMETAVPLLNGASISTVNQSEVIRKLVDQGLTIADAKAEFNRFELACIDFDQAQSIEAARLRPLTRHIGMSFADRACLALAGINGWVVYTADRRWAEFKSNIDIRLIR